MITVVWQDERLSGTAADRQIDSIHRRGRYVIYLWKIGNTGNTSRQPESVLELASMAELLDSGVIPQIVVEAIQRHFSA